MTWGRHPVTYRTRKLSLNVPMILLGPLGGKVGYCQVYREPEANASGSRVLNNIFLRTNEQTFIGSVASGDSSVPGTERHRDSKFFIMKNFRSPCPAKSGNVAEARDGHRRRPVTIRLSKPPAFPVPRACRRAF